MQISVGLIKLIGSHLGWNSKPALRVVLVVFALFSSSQETLAQLAADMVDATVSIETISAVSLQGIPSAVFSSQKHVVDYDGIIIQGTSVEELDEVMIRFSDSDDWSSMYVVESATSGDFLASYRGAMPFAAYDFEIAFKGLAFEAVSISLMGYFRNDSERDEEQYGDSNSQSTIPYAGVIDPPRIHPRSEWGAEGFIGNTSPLGNPNVNHITFHHAAGFGAENLSEGLAQVKAIQDFHQNGRGWSDIGYHFVVDEEGNLYQGRPYQNANASFEDPPALVRGAHAGGANTGNIGVCLLGCYHPAETSYPCNDSISPAALDSLTTVFAYLAENYRVETENLTGHRDWGNTSCPGDNNYSLIPGIEINMDQLLTFGQGPADSYILEQPFPNPSTTQTKLAYFLLRDGIATLKIFDSLGREVEEIISEFQDGGRWYSYNFVTSNLPSGVYFSNLEVEGFNGIDYEETKSFIVQ